MDATRFNHLLHRYLDAELTPGERHELQTSLLSEPEARREFWKEARLHAALRLLGEQTWGERDAAPPPPKVVRWRFQKVAWAAAAAGLAIGVFSASLVFGYVVPSLKTRRELFSDSFESRAKPSVNGQPLAAGHWGGDFTEIVGAQGQVQPAHGKHMLQFLRADHEGRHLPESFSSDSFHLLDVRPYKKELAAGTAVVRLSAIFNGEIRAEEGPFFCVLKLYALDAELIEERKAGTFTGSISERMLANSSGTRVRLDANPATWQKTGNELRLPPGTDYLLIQVGMANDSKRTDVRKDAFTAHYADRVQVVLAHVPEVTLP